MTKNQLKQLIKETINEAEPYLFKKEDEPVPDEGFKQQILKVREFLKSDGLKEICNLEIIKGYYPMELGAFGKSEIYEELCNLAEVLKNNKKRE